MCKSEINTVPVSVFPEETAERDRMTGSWIGTELLFPGSLEDWE